MSQIAVSWTQEVSSTSEEAKVKNLLNCKNESFAITTAAEYDKNGNVISSVTTGKTNILWDAIPPDSVMDKFKEILFAVDKPANDLRLGYKTLKPIIEKRLE